MKLVVNPFDMRTVKPDRIHMIIGHRGTGKSLIEEDLMYHLSPYFDVAFGFTPTKSSKEMMLRHFPPAFVYDKGFSKEAFAKILGIFQALVEAGKVRHGLVALDDCMADKGVYRGPTMRDVFLNGRHYLLTLLNSLQYCMDMERDLRSQIDYVYALHEDNAGNKRRLYDNFFGCFEKYEDFCKVLDKCTANHCALVLDRTQSGSNVSSKLFWYRVPWYRKIQIDGEWKDDPDCFPKFQLGRSVYWDLSYRYKAEETESSALALLRPRDMRKEREQPVSDNATKWADAGNPRVEVVVCSQEDGTDLMNHS